MDLRSSECNVYPCMLCVALVMCLFVLCVACLTVFCELFAETIRNIFGCVCYFVVEGDGVVVCGWRCLEVFHRICCVVPVVPVNV